jgi:hypothetical protein
MLKPNALRNALTNAVPEFKRNPSNLIMAVTSGSVAARFGDNLGYEYTYTLSIGALDYKNHPDTIIFPLIHWLRSFAPEKLQNHQSGNQAITFDVDIIDANSCDISIELVLSESVDITRQEDGTYRMQTRPEPHLVGFETIETSDATSHVLTPYGDYTIDGNGLIISNDAP